MEYLWLKALHAAVVIVFIGGLLAVSLTLRALPTPREELRTRSLQDLRQWDLFVTLPALLLVWIFGIVMAVQADLFKAPWLSIKLLIVLVISGLHGMLSGALRRLINDPKRPVPGYIAQVPAGIVIAVLIIAILAVVKPFTN